MPVLDGNMDEFSDARSLVASIKGGGGADAAAASVGDFLDALVPADDADQWRSTDAAAVAALIRGGGKSLTNLEAQV